MNKTGVWYAGFLFPFAGKNAEEPDNSHIDKITK